MTEADEPPEWPDGWGSGRQEAVALRAPGGLQLSAGGLAPLVRALASALAERAGAGPVAVLADGGVGLALAELGLLAAGLALCPLDPTDPRLPLVLDDLKPTLVLRLAEGPTEGLAWPAVLAGAPSGAELAPVPLDRPAHIFYTSGSSGRPKGCVVSREALASYAQGRTAAHRITAADVMMIGSAAGFDPWIGDLLCAQAAGCTLVVPGWARLLGQLPELVRSERASLLLSTPRMLAGGAPGRFGHSLRTVQWGGEPMGKPGAEAWLAEQPSVELYNLYGLTECAVYQASRRVGSPADCLLLGDPLGRCKLQFVCPSSLAPAESKGELLISGPQLAIGYLNRPNLTASSFLPPTERRPDRAFRTGDLWVRKQAGWQFAGRRDTQVVSPCTPRE